MTLIFGIICLLKLCFIIVTALHISISPLLRCRVNNYGRWRERGAGAH